MRMPCSAPTPVPTITAVGVARPSAHGHDTTTTAILVGTSASGRSVPCVSSHTWLQTASGYWSYASFKQNAKVVGSSSRMTGCTPKPSMRIVHKKNVMVLRPRTSGTKIAATLSA